MNGCSAAQPGRGRLVWTALVPRLEFGQFERRPPVHRWSDGTLLIGHCSLLILETDHARLRSLQVDPRLDEPIELRQMLGSSLKILRTAAIWLSYQCPMSNAQ